MIGIQNSISRYALQQDFLLNPNGLKISNTNRFGSVDGSGNINAIKSVSHGNLGESINQGVLASKPSLSENHFGTGKNAMYFNGNKDLFKSNSTFAPLVTDEFYIAVKFKTTQKANGCILAIGQGILGAGGVGVRLQVSTAGQLVFVFTTLDGGIFAKNLITYNNLADGTEKIAIVHHKGTDIITEDDIYIDSELIGSYTTRDDSMEGKRLYSEEGYSVNFRVGIRADGNARYIGHIGKIITGYGSPNIKAITKSIDSI